MSGRRPSLAVPPGSTDTHIQSRLGFERVVVVQPNAYQFDNRVTLEAMRDFGPQARGVAVVRPNAAEDEIERLTRAGVVGQRIFQLPWGAVNFERMHEVMARVHPFGWFANLQLDGRELPRWEESIRKLPGRFVIDHIGKFLEPVAVEAESFTALLRLLDTGRCWVKLAAAYETSKTGAPHYADVALLAKALVRHAPERMLWASNWPHPSAPKDRAPDDADLLDLLLDWVPDTNGRQKILVENPRELYGY